MSYQTDLKYILHNVVETKEVKGWKKRGHSESLAPVGITVHHTAGNYPSDLAVVTKGRSDLLGPLCNLYLAPDGIWYVVAAGVAYHAGMMSGIVMNEIKNGKFCLGDARDRGLVDDYSNGNSRLLGVEVSNRGTSTSKYPKKQIDSLVWGLAALCWWYEWNEQHIRHHREQTARKVDMSYRLNLRHKVAEAISQLEPNK